MVVAKKYVCAKTFDGMPTSKNFQIIEEELPELKDGEFLVEAVYLSVDPYMRVLGDTLKIGQTMFGGQVAKIIKSNSTKFPVGKYVVCNFGWRTHTIWKDNEEGFPKWGPPRIVEFGADVPLSLALGMLGMPGISAYFGFLEVCKPKPGETVVVTGAAGAVGSHVGQIAKIKGCKVIGIAGSNEKAQWLKSLGFDYTINYKTDDVSKSLFEAAPEGVDCYFDNVGGEISSTILQHMNRFGRISVVGAISSYNERETPKASIVQLSMLKNQLTMVGAAFLLWMDRWDEGVLQNYKWIQEGKLQYKETITEGFENMANAFIGMLKGDNFGKAIVKV